MTRSYALNPRVDAGSRPGLPLGASLVLLGVGAFAVRLIYILVIARAPVGIGGDAGFYHSAANLIAHGHFYDREIFGHAYKTAEHPPLFPLVLSVSSVLGGDSLLAHRIVGCAIGSCAVVLIALLAGKTVGQVAGHRAARRAGLIAGVFAAVYPPFVTADGLVMSEPLFVLLVTAALLVALSAIERPTTKAAAILGVIVGLAVLTRGEGLLLVPLLSWPVAYARRGGAPDPRSGRGGWAGRLLATTLATVVVLAPWVARNAIVFHRLIIATDSNGVIAGANCQDTYYGHDIGWWSLRCLERARTPAQLREGDASTSSAVTFAENHLTRLPLVASVRVLRTFDLYQPLRQGNMEPRRKWVDVVGLILYFPLLVLALLGAFAARPIRRWILLAPVWMVVIVSITGWGIGRFRVAADVSLIVFAVYYLVARSRRATIAASPIR